MVALEPPKMASQLRQLPLSKTDPDSFEKTCFESLSRNFADKSFTNLTLHILSLYRSNLESLTLQSLSLIAQNRLQRISFREVIFELGSFEETDKILEDNKAEGGAGTNSFPQLSFADKDQLAAQEAKTNSFFTQSFSDRI